MTNNGKVHPGVGQVLHDLLINLQVCVPKDWTDQEIEAYAAGAAPTGIASQWQVCTKENCERYVQCQDDKDKIHVILRC